MTLTSNSTVDLLKHIIEKNAYAFKLKQIKRIVFSVGSGMGFKDD